VKRKPSVYLDTSFVSALHYRGSHLECQVRGQQSQEWWLNERKYFDLVASEITESELEAGHFRRQSQALAEIRRVRYLVGCKNVSTIANTLLQGRIVPENKPYDAMQLAFCIHYEIDYLLSWNYAHLANPEVQRQLERRSYTSKWVVPLLVTPETIPQVRFGAEPGRKTDAKRKI
jgi:predicted nucleic acid-binding protein